MSKERQDNTNDVQELLGTIESYLEERKEKADRRQQHDPEHPNSSEETCRRTGIDRRESA